jgi:hypothetical protein
MVQPYTQFEWDALLVVALACVGYWDIHSSRREGHSQSPITILFLTTTGDSRFPELYLYPV